jgi:hypothetical protein
MAKRLKLNLGTGELTELGGTDLLPHPASFPLGSAESRAAARAMIGPDRMRRGDTGVTEEGNVWMVVARDQEKPELGLIQLILPWSADGKWLDLERPSPQPGVNG